VQVVGLYFQCQYSHPLRISYFLQNGLQPCLDAPHEYLAPPLRAPDEMIVDQIDLVCRMLVFHDVYRIPRINNNSKRKERLIHPQH
jgi:hypothetical protein